VWGYVVGKKLIGVRRPKHRKLKLWSIVADCKLVSLSYLNELSGQPHDNISEYPVQEKNIYSLPPVNVTP
jgi:hypothetical protein